MSTLILKLGATGDVVRTTSLLHKLTGPVTWITAPKNAELLMNGAPNVRCLTWEERQRALDREYDLVINLEDELEVGQFLRGVKTNRLFGAYLDASDKLCYTKDSHGWFDLSLISAYGRQEADRRKLLNRRTYQALIFEGLGFEFSGERYVLPAAVDAGLSGDIAIAREAGPVWPMKNWAFYDRLKSELEAKGLVVNVLQKRASLLQHLADVKNHSCLVSGDSLPMHLALASGTRCVGLFTCTSPWEIYEYGLLTKLVSPLLDEFFFRRGFDERATTAIPFEKVMEAVMAQLKLAKAPPHKAASLAS